MRRVKTWSILGTAALSLVLMNVRGVTSSTPAPMPSPGNTNNFDMSIFDQPGTKSGSSQYDGILQLYSDRDKKHVFQLGPQPLYDVSSSAITRDPSYKSSLSPGLQNNMSFGIGIPFGSTEPDKKPPKMDTMTAEGPGGSGYGHFSRAP